MIKFPILDAEPKKIRQVIPTKLILSEPLALDGAELIPIDLGGRLITSVSLNELGKQLLKSAAEGDVDEIKSLLAKGAAFTADWLGTSPLHLAAQNNHLEVCEILLRAGISKDARTKVDRTPLHMAAYEGHLEIVRTLLNHGADYVCKDLLGMTPLHWAVQNGHYACVEELMKKCAHSLYTDKYYYANKFNLTPIDIADQIGRNDIIELLNNCSPDTELATESLVVQLAADSIAENEEDDIEHTVPLETVLMTDDESMDTENIQVDATTEDDSEQADQQTEEIQQPEENSFSASIKLLQDHGITMLPNDESNILTTMMESGHTVVLTDVGKEVLDSVKQSEDLTNKKIITVTQDEFLAMTGNNPALMSKNNGSLKLSRIVPKKMVVKKNKVIPVTNTSLSVPKLPKEVKDCTDMELVMTQLIEARKTIEEYKAKLLKKEQEAERYKEQLRQLMDAS